MFYLLASGLLSTRATSADACGSGGGADEGLSVEWLNAHRACGDAWRAGLCPLWFDKLTMTPFVLLGKSLPSLRLAQRILDLKYCKHSAGANQIVALHQAFLRNANT
jgi:hypothetical protein